MKCTVVWGLSLGNRGGTVETRASRSAISVGATALFLDSSAMFS
jgi:hypothetical protein